MTEPRTSDNPVEPLPALEQVWKVNAALVNRLKLRFLRNGMAVIGRSWFVPLVSDEPTADAYELARAINNLQEQVERASQLDVTLALDPAA